MTQRTYVRTDEIRRKISESLKGRVISEETRNKLSLTGTGRIHSLETKQKMSETWKRRLENGYISPRLGKHCTEESKEKMRQVAIRRFISEDARKKIGLTRLGKSLSEEIKKKISDTRKKRIVEGSILSSVGFKGRHHSEETKIKISNASSGRMPWILGKHHSDEAKKKISKALTGKKLYLSEDERKRRSERFSGANNPMFNHKFYREKSPNWLGGKSFELYGLDFDKQHKQAIRYKDNYRCQHCFRHESELRTTTNKPYKLAIHHIDYDKKNNKPENLISLCRPCHAQTNYKRNDWVKYFKEKNRNVGKQTV